jgi:hypothetical protein
VSWMDEKYNSLVFPNLLLKGENASSFIEQYFSLPENLK